MAKRADKHTEAFRVRYIRKYGHADTMAELAAALGVSETTIRRLRDKHDLPRRDPRRLDKTDAELIEALKEIRAGRRTIASYAREWGFGETTISNHLRDVQERHNDDNPPPALTPRMVLTTPWRLSDD